MTQNHKNHVSQRLSFADSLCTVRYIGPVAGTKGEWLGVEWDDPSRGKHSGEHEGVKYFDCLSQKKTAGSFIRPSRRADPTVSFLEALKDKYAPEEQRSGPTYAPIKWGGKDVEEVGFEKIRKQQALLEDLRVIILEKHLVAESENLSGHNQGLHEEAEKIAQTCPNMSELGLGFNLFEDWAWIVSVSSKLSKLKNLRVSGNRFSSHSLTSSESNTSKVFCTSVDDLAMDIVLLNWSEIQTAAANFPNLVSLSLAANLLKNIPSCALSQTIKKLNLDDNSFETLDAIAPIASLDNLETLQLRRNRISEISLSEKKFVLSQSIKTLDLSNNQIKAWEFVNSLPHVVPLLINLRISSNPLYQGDGVNRSSTLSIEDAFLLTCARLKNLQVLNFSNISIADRQNAELHYLSTIAREISKAPSDSEHQILAQHPRWNELCEQYGTPGINRVADSAVHANSLQAQLINLEISLSSDLMADRGLTESTKQIKVPRFWDIYKMKAHIGRQLGFNGLRTKMTLRSAIWEPEKGGGQLNAYAQWEYEDEKEPGEGEGQWVESEEELKDSINPVSFWVGRNEGQVIVDLREEYE